MVTLWIPDVWESLISKIPDQDLRESYQSLPQQIREGFTLGVSTKVKVTYTPESVGLTEEDSKVVDDYFLQELEADRMEGPFSLADPEAAIVPFQCVPFKVVPKETALGDPPKF